MLLSYFTQQINRTLQIPRIFELVSSMTVMHIQMQLQWNGGRNSLAECVALNVTHFSALPFCTVHLFISLPYFILSVDPPTVRLLGAPQIDLEEGKDSLVLRCEADANPPASIVWKRAGRSEIASLQVSNMLIRLFCYFVCIFCSAIHLPMPRTRMFPYQ